MLSRAKINDDLYHELGHACQFSSRTVSDSFRLYNASISELDLQEDFESRFPKSVWGCLRARARDWAGDTVKKRNIRAREIFADFVFLEKRRHLLDFYRLCLSEVDLAHPAADEYMDCYLGDSEVKAKLCPSLAKQSAQQASQPVTHERKTNNQATSAADSGAAESGQKTEPSKANPSTNTPAATTPAKTSPGINFGGDFPTTGTK